MRCINVIVLVVCYLETVSAQLQWVSVSQGALVPPARRDCGFGYDTTRNQLVLWGGRPYDTDTWIFDIAAGELKL